MVKQNANLSQMIWSVAEQIANRWNTFDISARGDRLVVAFNGVQTVDVRDARLKAGPVALQSAAGTIRFRKVMIRTA